MTHEEPGHVVRNEPTGTKLTTYTIKYVCDNCGTQQITITSIPPRSCNQCGMLFMGVRKE